MKILQKPINLMALDPDFKFWKIVFSSNFPKPEASENFGIFFWLIWRHDNFPKNEVNVEKFPEGSLWSLKFLISRISAQYFFKQFQKFLKKTIYCPLWTARTCCHAVLLIFRVLQPQTSSGRWRIASGVALRHRRLALRLAAAERGASGVRPGRQAVAPRPGRPGPGGLRGLKNRIFVKKP